MSDKTYSIGNYDVRIRWTMFARILIVTLLLGITTFADLEGMRTPSLFFSSLLIRTILLTYLLSIFFGIVLKYLPNSDVNIYLQSLCDVLLITLMVYATGGIRSIYSILYPLVIIYTVLFLGRRGGMVIASAAGGFYGIFANLEFYGVIYPILTPPLWDYPLHAGYVLTRVLTHFLSFYLIAFLTSFVVEQERRARTLLAEKQSSFDQLDILHRSIIESVDTGIMTVNLQGQIKSFNRAAIDITGLQLKEVENKRLTDIFGNFPHLPSNHTYDGTEPFAGTRFERPFSTKGGKDLILGCSVSALKAPSGDTIGNILIFQDLTQINQLHEAMERNKRFAFVGEIAAGLAHEIRNPLASITGSIQMLRQELALNETNERLMQIILRGKDQLESFLRDFLLMTRPAPGVRVILDVRDTIKDVLESLRYVPEWLEDRHHVVVDLPDTPLLIHANRTEIRQILWNVILNALQSMPEGGDISIIAHPSDENESNCLTIRIHDTGCGISREGLKRIFEPFYTTREKGTGLGLAVVKRIIESYSGKIDIQSITGRGTSCIVSLPLMDMQEDVPS